MSEMIRRLRVALQLETAGFERGSKRAAAEVDQLGSKMEKAGFAVGRMGKAVIGAGALIAGSALASQLKDMVTQGLEYASALGEQAQQLGVSTKALQEYRHIATQVGVEQGEMDAALAKLTRTMGEAAQGAKGPTEAFNRLGIDIKAFVASGGDAGDLIPIIAQKLTGLGSDSERAATLVDLFGRAGQKLAPLMSEGAKGIEAMRKEARELGIVLSDQQIQNADATADKLAKFQNVFNIRIAGVVADNATAIGQFADKLAALADKALTLLGALAKLDSNPTWRKIFAGASIATNPFAAVDFAAQALNQRGGGSAPASRPSASAPRGTAGGAFLRLPKTGTRGSFVPGRGPMANLSGGGGFLGNLDRATAGGLGGVDPGAGLAAIGASFDEAAAAAGRFNRVQDETQNRAETTTVSIARSFQDMANDTISALDRVASAVRGGGFLSILSSVIGLGLQLGSAGLFGKSVAGRINAPAIPARAMGGPVSGGRLHLVGERGPELFVPGSSGSIVPNHALGGGNTYHISGNLLTPEFWQRIQAGDMAAADAGGSIGLARARAAGNWRLR